MIQLKTKTGTPKKKQFIIQLWLNVCLDEKSGLEGSRPEPGWSRIVVPDKNSLISDAGKLMVLDGLLTRLKEEGHRVLIYTQVFI